jgi:hypothetical protein
LGFGDGGGSCWAFGLWVKHFARMLPVLALEGRKGIKAHPFRQGPYMFGANTSPATQGADWRSVREAHSTQRPLRAPILFSLKEITPSGASHPLHASNGPFSSLRNLNLVTGVLIFWRLFFNTGRLCDHGIEKRISSHLAQPRKRFQNSTKSPPGGPSKGVSLRAPKIPQITKIVFFFLGW